MKLKKISGRTALALLPMFLLVSGTAFADDDDQEQDSWSINVGLRAWYRSLTAYGDTPLSEIKPIVQVGARNGRFLVGANFSPSVRVKIKDDFTLKETEYDISAGYYILPRLALSAGYKGWHYPGGANDGGPFAGVSGSVPMKQRTSLYGSVAYGKMNADGGGHFNYLLLEPGIAFAFSPEAERLDALALTVGYRAQRFGLEGLHYWFHGVNLGLTASF